MTDFLWIEKLTSNAESVSEAKIIGNINWYRCHHNSSKWNSKWSNNGCCCIVICAEFSHYLGSKYQVLLLNLHLKILLTGRKHCTFAFQYCKPYYLQRQTKMNMSKTKDKNLLYMKLQLRRSYQELHQLYTVMKEIKRPIRITQCGHNF